MHHLCCVNALAFLRSKVWFCDQHTFSWRDSLSAGDLAFPYLNSTQKTNPASKLPKLLREFRRTLSWIPEYKIGCAASEVSALPSLRELRLDNVTLAGPLSSQMLTHLQLRTDKQEYSCLQNIFANSQAATPQLKILELSMVFQCQEVRHYSPALSLWNSRQVYSLWLYLVPVLVNCDERQLFWEMKHVGAAHTGHIVASTVPFTLYTVSTVVFTVSFALCKSKGHITVATVVTGNLGVDDQDCVLCF